MLIYAHELRRGPSLILKLNSEYYDVSSCIHHFSEKRNLYFNEMIYQKTHMAVVFLISFSQTKCHCFITAM